MESSNTISKKARKLSAIKFLIKRGYRLTNYAGVFSNCVVAIKIQIIKLLSHFKVLCILKS